MANGVGNGLTVWSLVRSHLKQAAAHATIGIKPPSMTRFYGVKRWLALKAAKVVSYLSRFLTRQQGEYNQAMVHAVETLARGLYENERALLQMQAQHPALCSPAAPDSDALLAANEWDAIPVHDFSEMLHALRTRLLRQMPPGGQVVLSGGCSGGWYFRWFTENYPSVTRHIGIEAYSPRPDDLPEGVDWYADTLAHMNHVGDEMVDLIFSGQTMEHIWPYDITHFLLESARVLKPGGWIVLDSPNRRITHPYAWVHPEHTVEYTVEEIVELLEIAGFVELKVKGIWLCYDRDNHRILPMEPSVRVPDWPNERRMAEAEHRPQDSFIWWIEGRKGNVPAIDSERLYLRAAEIYDRVWPVVQGRCLKIGGQLAVEGKHRIVTQPRGSAVNLIHGPGSPLRAGSYEMSFRVAALDETELRQASPDGEIGTIDVYGRDQVLFTRPILARELIPNRYAKVTLPFAFKDVVFGTQFRLFTSGRIGLKVRYAVENVAID